MLYFPVFLQQDIVGHINDAYSLALLFGTSRKSDPDLNGFNRVKINPRIICGQHDQMHVYLKPIDGFNLSTNGKLEFTSTSSKENTLHHYQNHAKIEVMSGDQVHVYEVKLGAIKYLFWTTQFNCRFYVLICIDKQHPEVYSFAIVSEEWVKQYKFEDLDSK